jgi:glycosyltransferase involved in cell wall biosynthesis
MLNDALFYAFAAFSFVQIFYHLLYFIRIPFFKGYPSAADENNPEPISIVVCAHNEAENLKELIPLLLEQDHPDFEIIIVDDKSSDETYDYISLEKLRNPKLRVVKIDETPDKFNSKKYALTLGIKAAKNDIVLLTDADCRPNSKSWARKMAATFTPETQIVLGYSHYKKGKGLLGNLIDFETLLSGILYISSALSFRPYMGVGRNLAYRKSFFLSRKGFFGFMEVTGGDDDIFVNKYASKKITRVNIGSETLVWTFPKNDWASYFTQKKRHLAAGKLYKNRDKTRIGLFHLSLYAMWLLLPVIVVLTILHWTEIFPARPELLLAAAVFIVRLVLMYTLYILSSKRFGVKIAGYNLIFSEIIYLFYYFIAGISAQSSKSVKW